MQTTIMKCQNGYYPFLRSKFRKYAMNEDNQSLIEQQQQILIQYTVQPKDCNQRKTVKSIVEVLKDFKCQNCMKLVKLTKDESKYNFYYEFYDKSLVQKIKQLKSVKYFNNILEGLECCMRCLCRQNILCDIEFNNIAVNTDNVIKVFIPPNLQFQENNQSLKQHYESEIKLIEFLIHDKFYEYHGCPLTIKQHEKSPNFIVKGNTLQFNSIETTKVCEHQEKKDTSIYKKSKKCITEKKQELFDTIYDSNNQQMQQIIFNRNKGKNCLLELLNHEVQLSFEVDSQQINKEVAVFKNNKPLESQKLVYDKQKTVSQGQSTTSIKLLSKNGCSLFKKNDDKVDNNGKAQASTHWKRGSLNSNVVSKPIKDQQADLKSQIVNEEESHQNSQKTCKDLVKKVQDITKRAQIIIDQYKKKKISL